MKYPERLTYSQEALRPLDYPCEIDGKTVSDHEWVVIDWQTEKVIRCNFSQEFLTAPQ